MVREGAQTAEFPVLTRDKGPLIFCQGDRELWRFDAVNSKIARKERAEMA